MAGINEKYHGPALQELKALINAGKHEEAKEYAVNYILEWTGKENRVRSTNMGLELFMRDATFNRG